MEAKKLFAVVGTDARQAAAGRVLERAGYAVGGAEQVALADYILLPLPLDAARTPLAELLRAAKPGAAALGVACDEAFKSMKESIAHVREVKQTLLEGILALPDTQLNGDSLEEASPYVLNVTFKGLRSEVLLHALESKGIVVSAGSACDSKKKVGSPVLTAMGLPFSEIEGAIRFSFCRYNTVEEAKECLKALEELVPFFRKYNR